MEVVVKHDNGMRFAATCGSYTVVSGQGDDGDESRDGMRPAQLFVASIGIYIAGYVASYCQHHGIPYEDIVIELDRDTARAPWRTTKMDARIRLPVAVSEKEARAIAQVADRCHITSSIVHGLAINVFLDSQSKG